MRKDRNITGTNYRDIETARVLRAEEIEGIINVAFVPELAIHEAHEFVSSCEYCAESAAISFDYLLDAVTGCDPTVTEYLMCRTPRCPVCQSEITEKTCISLY